MSHGGTRQRETQLDFCPYYMDEWERRCEGLTAAEEGLLMRAVRAAWKATPRCTLDARPAAIERLVGSPSRKAAKIIHEHFKPCAETPGRLRCDWLWARYQVQLEKYQSAATRGRGGGERSGETRRRREPGAGKKVTPLRRQPRTAKAGLEARLEAELQAQPTQIEDVVLTTHNRPDGAGAPYGALASAPAASSGREGVSPDAALAWVSENPSVAAEIESHLMARFGPLPPEQPGHVRRGDPKPADFMHAALRVALTELAVRHFTAHVEHMQNLTEPKEARSATG
jgi:uncharacterized protein YdaU (DUF1376 family)